MKTMRNILTRNQGFLLAEITIGILILSIALLPISGLFIQAVQGDTVGRNYTMAANLAQKQLELLKLYPPSYWAELSLPCTIPWQDEGMLPTANYIIKTKAISITSSLVQVVVTATWQERGINYTLEFMTLYPTL